MKSNRTATIICSLLLAVFFAGTVLSRAQVEKLRGKEVTLEEVLYMPSGKSVKRGCSLTRHSWNQTGKRFSLTATHFQMVSLGQHGGFARVSR